jgi:hypothetical protein
MSDERFAVARIGVRAVRLTARRRTGLIALASGMLLLAGCTSAQTSPEVSPTVNADPTPSGPVPPDLSFEAGMDLSGGDWETAWDESLGDTPGFSVVSEDDGSGFWAYVNDTTQCQIQFMNGPSGVADTSLGDLAMTDELLVQSIVTPAGDVTREDVLGNAYDDAVSQSPGPGTVAVRTIRATTAAGETWLRSARVFGAAGGAATYIGINCPSGQDAHSEFTSLVESNIAIAVEDM